MNRGHAITAYFKYNLTAKYALVKLMKWKRGMSIDQYANELKCSRTWAYQFAHHYGLEFTGRAKHMLNARALHSKERAKREWNKDLTISENARAIGVSYSTARNWCAKFHLDAKLKRRSQDTINQMLRVKGYLDKDLCQAEIARIMSLTRERIRQIVEMLKQEKML